MKLTLKRALAAFILVLSFAAPVAASSGEGARAAYDRGDYVTALQLFRPLADQGDAYAQTRLGFMYSHGQGLPPDFAAAMQWFRRAADQGYAEAQARLGFMYEKGIGVPQDDVSAHMWLNLAAAQGNQDAIKLRDLLAQTLTPAQIAEAQKFAREWKPRQTENQTNEPARTTTIDPFEAILNARPEESAKARTFADGAAAYDRGDYASALRVFRPLADQGFGPAQGIIGIMYEQGQGVPENDTEAVKWFRLAADQGNSVGQIGLGAIYSKGKGVPQDDIEAAKWYRLAAIQGVAMAQYNLAVRYYQGRGVPQNFIFAYVWFNLAALQNYADAAKNRDLAGQRMTPAQIAEAQKLAREWKPKLER